MTNLHVQLDDQSKRFVDVLIRNGEYADADQAVNALLHRFGNANQKRLNWLQAELQKGEDSGKALPYTPTLLDEIEQDALNEIESGNLEIDPSVAPIKEPPAA